MNERKDIVKAVVDYIEENLKEDISLDIIADRIGYSKFYLNRIFSESTGITIYRYLQNRRLTAAAEKLVESDEPILQIAYEAGYDTQQAFSYAFKQIYHQPPKVYREIGLFVPKQGRIFMRCANLKSGNYGRFKGAAA